ncbi:MAG: type I restriction-modification system subunit M [Roseburia sp.]|nr:type I restriction-modification system subunit M [Roseburia sp.]
MLPESAKNKIEQIWLDVIAGGVSQPTEVIEQLTYLMFAKQLDEMEADIETSQLLSGKAQEHLFGEAKEEQALRWRNFRKLEARALYEIFSQKVFPFIKSVNKDKDSSFSRFLSDATFKINEPLALQKVVSGLDDLFEHDIRGLDMQGDLYEHMLAKLNSAGRLGAFRTPKQIRDMMVKLMQPTVDMLICDPACGTAGFLISCAEYIREQYERKMSEEQWEHYRTSLFTGYDTDATMCRLSCMNLMLHSVSNPKIEKRDSVSKDYSEEGRYHLILANPPFKGTLNKENISDKLKGITNTTKSELLFVGMFMQMLKVGGRCACIVPDGVLFGSSNAHKSLRKELVENQYLEAVISLPSGVFKPYAGVSTAVLIFTKTNSGGTEDVWFYDMKADGYSLDDKRQPIAENDIPDIIERFHHLEGERGRSRTEQSFFAKKSEIAENEYDLSINKYRQIEYVAKEYPPTSEIIRDIEERHRKIGEQIEEIKALLNIGEG